MIICLYILSSEYSTYSVNNLDNGKSSHLKSSRYNPFFSSYYCSPVMWNSILVLDDTDSPVECAQHLSRAINAVSSVISVLTGSYPYLIHTKWSHLHSQHMPSISLPPLEGSDHDTLQVTLNNCRPPSRKTNHKKVWLYKQAVFDTANSTLWCLPTAMYSTNDVNSFGLEWYDIFTTIITETIPSRKIKPKSKVPYTTADLVHLVRKKAPLQPSQKNWNEQGMVQVRQNMKPSDLHPSLCKKSLLSPTSYWSLLTSRLLVLIL